jgi:hypothetical protein
MAEFRAFRDSALAFHVDLRPYRVSEIGPHLRAEIEKVTEQRDRATTEMAYHKAHGAWSTRNQENLRDIERNLNATSERLENLQEIEGSLSERQQAWARAEGEGLLYGHETVDKDESKHRTNPHVNVAGPTVSTKTETFKLFLKLTIYVRGE